MGTGGDFRRSLGIEAGFERCLEALVSGRERMVDVGRASFRGMEGRPVRYFVNVLSAGLGGLVDRYIERMPTFLGGRIGYYLAALGAVIVSKEQPLRARITWQGETREEIIPAYLVAICNGRWFGGGMDVAPMAFPDDGRLEVVTVTAAASPTWPTGSVGSTPDATSKNPPCIISPVKSWSCGWSRKRPSAASCSMSMERRSARSRSA